MIVVNLPSPSLYKQVVLSQPSWKQDISITRQSGLSRRSSASNKIAGVYDENRISALDSGSRYPESVSQSTSRSIRSIDLDEIYAMYSSSLSSERSNLGMEMGNSCPSAECGSVGNHVQGSPPPIRVRLPKIEPCTILQSSSRRKEYQKTCSSSVYRSDNASTELETVGRVISASAETRNNSDGINITRIHSSSGKTSTSDTSSSKDSEETGLSSWSDLPDLTLTSAVPSPLKLNRNKFQDPLIEHPARLTRQKTLEMYRANVKRTTDVEALYSFAMLLIATVQDAHRTHDIVFENTEDDLLVEACQILQKLADKSHPFAQYSLADGYASGLFSNGKGHDKKALTLFIAAGKHGHTEAGYRAGCCFELGWGTRVDHSKAIKLYRQSASKNHLGAMTRLSRAWLFRDLGGGIMYREGLKWLKRAAALADKYYNTAPYDLGCLYETGYGDDIFRDENYAMQLFLQAANLDHADAAFKIGQAYEFGRLLCPRDPALSLQFYTMAAYVGHAESMFAVCAWYMVGIEGVLEINDTQAYEWARNAARLGLVQAQYAVGYFTEVGIGRKSDPLEANAWYIRAAEQGHQKALERTAAMNSSVHGRSSFPLKSRTRNRVLSDVDESQKRYRLFRPF